jgi:hypothetical protein
MKTDQQHEETNNLTSFLANLAAQSPRYWKIIKSVSVSLFFISSNLTGFSATFYTPKSYQNVVLLSVTRLIIGLTKSSDT